MSVAPPILIIGVGNPSRGDDALGPLLIERLQTLRLPGVELLTDFQLQVEYALDLQDRLQVIFVDASVNTTPPFTFTPVHATEDDSFSSHALSPGAVLHAYRKLLGVPPASAVLAIHGEAFELGESLSGAAARNLEAAIEWLTHSLSEAQSQVRDGRPIAWPNVAGADQNAA